MPGYVRLTPGRFVGQTPDGDRRGVWATASRALQREAGRLSSHVRDVLAARIGSGQAPPGTKLPPEPDLAEEFGVSRATLREALRSLEEDGFITRARGVGTFVTHRPRLINNLDVNFAVTDAIRAAGGNPGTESLRVETAPATPDQAERLALSPGEEVVVIRRVRTADRRRVVYSVDVLPRTLVGPDLGVLDQLMEISIYELLERELGITVHHAVTSFRPEKADRLAASMLLVIRGAILMHLIQVDFHEDGRPVQYSNEYHLADAFDFTVVRKGPGRRFT